MAEPSDIPPLRDLRYRLEYAVLRLVIGFVRLFPIDVAGAISGRLWRLIAPYNRRHKRALANLKRAFPDKTAEERQLIAEATSEIAQHEGQRPRGWLGPALSESHRTLDILAENGIQYVDRKSVV